MNTSAYAKKINMIKLTFDEEEWIKTRILEKDPIYIHVGELDEAFYFDMLESDKSYGILKDILEDLSNETGLEFQYVGEGEDRLIDYFSLPRHKVIRFNDTSQYMDNLNYNIVGVYTDPYKCYTKDLSIDKVYDLEGKKVGFLKTSTYEQFIKTYPELDINTVFLNTEYDVQYVQADVDAIISDQRLREYMYTRTMDLPNLTTKKGFIINQEYQILAGIISKHIAFLNDSGQLNKMIIDNRERYMRSAMKLTEDEKSWLSNNRVIKYAVRHNYPPFDNVSSDGVHSGINKDYLNKVSSILGINIVFDNSVKFSKSGIKQNLAEGKIHFTISEPYLEEKEKEFNFVKLYSTNRITVIGNHSSRYVNKEIDLRNKTVALQKHSWLIDYLKSKNLGIKIIETDTLEAAFELVVKGNADYTLEKLIVINELLFEIESTKYRLSGTLNVDDILCMAVAKEYPELASILDKVNIVIDYNELVNFKSVINTTNRSGRYIVWIVVGGLALVFICLVLIALTKIVALSVKRQKEDLSKRKRDYESTLTSIVDSLEEASMLNDSETGTHNKRVSYYCGFLARQYGLSDEMIIDIKEYASLHDIGKIGISAQILKKPGKLTKEEFEEIKKHVTIGYNLIGRLSIPDVAKNIVYYHHENYDGTGYASGMIGDNIPIEARIMAVADVYDALRTKRSYKKGYSHQEAVEIILSEKGKKFDPVLVDIFEENNEVFEVIYELNALDDENQ